MFSTIVVTLLENKQRKSPSSTYSFWNLLFWFSKKKTEERRKWTYDEKLIKKFFEKVVKIKFGSHQVCGECVPARPLSLAWASSSWPVTVAAMPCPVPGGKATIQQQMNLMRPERHLLSQPQKRVLQFSTGVPINVFFLLLFWRLITNVKRTRTCTTSTYIGNWFFSPALVWRNVLLVYFMIFAFRRKANKNSSVFLLRRLVHTIPQIGKTLNLWCSSCTLSFFLLLWWITGKRKDIL